MAFEIPGLSLSLVSSGDMSDHQYKAVAFSTTNADQGGILQAVRGGKNAGVWLDNSTAATAGKVQFTGVAKLMAGDSSAMENAIAYGDPVVASSVGVAVPSTAAAQHVLGYALGAMSTGSTGMLSVQLTIGAIST